MLDVLFRFLFSLSFFVYMYFFRSEQYSENIFSLLWHRGDVDVIWRTLDSVADSRDIHKNSHILWVEPSTVCHTSRKHPGIYAFHAVLPSTVLVHEALRGARYTEHHAEFSTMWPEVQMQGKTPTRLFIRLWNEYRKCSECQKWPNENIIEAYENSNTRRPVQKDGI